MTNDEFKAIFRMTDEELEIEKRYFEASERLGRALLSCLSVIVGPDEKRAEEMIHAVAGALGEKPETEEET